MSPPKKLPPVHVDILRIWNERGMALSQEASIAEELEALLATWEEIAECKRESGEGFNPVRAQMEYELDLHIGQVKCFCPHWLADTFEPDQTVELQRAICEFLYPEHSWECIGIDDGEWVVTNEPRSLVCSFKLSKYVSAAAALVLAGDKELKPSSEALNEAAEYRGHRYDLQESRLRILEQTVEKYSGEGTLIPFPLN